ncbi:TPA: hypothetical protein ACH3X2_009456 [Trebouxia sp. C0005]
MVQSRKRPADIALNPDGTPTQRDTRRGDGASWRSNRCANRAAGKSALPHLAGAVGAERLYSQASILVVKELTVNWQRGDTSWSDQLNGIRMTDAVDVNRVYDVLSSRISSRRGDAVSEAGWQDALRLLPKTDKRTNIRVNQIPKAQDNCGGLASVIEMAAGACVMGAQQLGQQPISTSQRVKFDDAHVVRVTRELDGQLG